jgi:meso-butanediol dehydrogenase / (S,S)-butanediol dehydrogenase / diacetyl reductase
MWAEAAYVLGRSNPMLQGLTPDQVFQGAVQNMIPLKRPQMPEDIGNAVVFLASEEAKEITGQALNVDGGAFFS